MSVAQRGKALSWRDPDGFVIESDGRILRAVAPAKADKFRELISSPWMTRLIAQGLVPATSETVEPELDAPMGDGWLWLEHDRIAFPAYPHEITALQLYESAQLTLLVGLEAAQNGWTLKDASAWNVLHGQGRAVFVDLLSFDQLAPSGMWRAYGQFVRHFVLPLLLYRKTGLTPPEIFLTHRDGITPERAFECLHGAGRLSLTALEYVLLPKWFSRAGGNLIKSQTDHKPRPIDPELATVLPSNTLHRLQGTIEKLRPDGVRSASVWKRYEEERAHYSDADIAEKTRFVRTHLAGSRTVLDLGCNAGEFSLIAAEAGAAVVAADSDHAVLSRLYERIRGSRPPITPVLVNIGRPTPSVGWLNSEVPSFLERSTGRFDCVLALGLLHHLLVSERATLPMIVDLLGRVSANRVIVEWIDPTDPKFRQLAGFDIELYTQLDSQALETLMSEKFALEAKLLLPCQTRVMYSWSVINSSQSAGGRR